MKGGTMGSTDGPGVNAEIPMRPKGRFSVRTKIIVFLVSVLAPLATITWITAIKTTRDSMTNEFGGYMLLLAFGGASAIAILAGALFARHITKPIAQLVAVAQQVGQGDLSQLVPVMSRDEI